jgi:hypothetical protein
MPVEDTKAQEAVVLELLDRADGVTVEDLCGAVRELSAERASVAVASLVEAGVACIDRDLIFPTPALERLDALGLIHI